MPRELVKEWHVGETATKQTVKLRLYSDGKLECTCYKGSQRPNAGVYGSGCPHTALFEAVIRTTWETRAAAYDWTDKIQKANLARVAPYVMHPQYLSTVAGDPPPAGDVEAAGPFRLINLED